MGVRASSSFKHRFEMLLFVYFVYLASLKEKRSVDLLKFILFLYVQHAHVISLKSPIVTGDEYPSKSRLQDLEGRAAIGTKVIY